MLVKWQCHDCEKAWLMLEEDTKDVSEIVCPFCKKSDNAEAVTGQNHDHNFKEDMGCLWPGYNEFDKLGRLVAKGELTQDQIRERFNALLNRK